MTQRRNRRSGVEDRWRDLTTPRQDRNDDGTPMVDTDGKPVMTLRPVGYGQGSRWRARYVDHLGVEHSRAFKVKADARSWLDRQTSAVVTGTHVAPRDALTTVQQWADTWIEGYGINRASTVRQARTHLTHITAEFGALPLAAVRPSHVKRWVASLKGQFSVSYVYALHARLAQLFADAVHDGLLPRNPCSRKTAPPMGKQKCYVATTAQVWALYDELPEHLRAAVLLGAFVGLRVAEASALEVAHCDLMRGVVTPVQQWPDKPLKTDGSSASIPIPHDLTLLLAASVQRYPSPMMVTRGVGGEPAPPWVIEREVRAARDRINTRAKLDDAEGLPETFSFHDLRHYLASLLIASGADVKTVQARMRHASARTTLDTYSHLWPDADESTRAAVAKVLAERMDSKTAADDLRTETGQ